MNRCKEILNLLFIFVLCAVLLGSYAYQFFLHQEPCVLCLLQRLGMTAIAVALLLNIRFGIKVQYYGLAILGALFGGSVSLRHISFHISSGLPHFGGSVLGFDLYVWSFIIFVCSILATAVLLILEGFFKTAEYEAHWGYWEHLAFWLVFLITIIDAYLVLLECGLGTCIR